MGEGEEAYSTHSEQHRQLAGAVDSSGRPHQVLLNRLPELNSCSQELLQLLGT